MTRTVEQARDPRIDPKPGDVVGGSVVKAKVVAIERRETESGVEVSVGYICAGRNVEFKTNWPPVVRPLELWITFAKNAEVIHATPVRVFEGEGADAD